MGFNDFSFLTAQKAYTRAKYLNRSSDCMIDFIPTYWLVNAANNVEKPTNRSNAKRYGICCNLLKCRGSFFHSDSKKATCSNKFALCKGIPGTITSVNVITPITSNAAFFSRFR